MVDTKLSALTELAAIPAADDEVYIRDVSEAAANESKRITITNLMDAAARTATLIVAANDASAKSKAGADYVCDGTSDNVQIQAAIDALTSGRTHSETVKCIGGFSISAALSLSSYTRLDLTEATITLANNSNCEIIVNSDTTNGNNNISIRGGSINGNYSNQTGGNNAIALSKSGAVNDAFNTVEKVYVYDSWGKGIYMGLGNHNKVLSCTVANSGSNGIDFFLCNYGTIEDNKVLTTRAGVGILLNRNCQYNKITGNYVESSFADGIQLRGYYDVEQYTIHNIVDGNVVVDAGNIGIYLNEKYNTENIVVNNIVYGSYDDGIEVYYQTDATKTYPSRITISNNKIYSNGKAGTSKGFGIWVRAGSGHIIEGNEINKSYRGGISLVDAYLSVIVNNISSNNGQRGAAFLHNGIELFSPSSNNIIIGNICTDTQGTPTQAYGIIEAGSSDNNLITGNSVSGNTITQILTVGANTKVRNNQGYITENSGTATVLNTTTTIVVNHGLATTPTRVYLTPTNSMGLATNFWINTLTTTQFTINVNTDPGATTAIFNWKAVIGEGN